MNNENNNNSSKKNSDNNGYYNKSQPLGKPKRKKTPNTLTEIK